MRVCLAASGGEDYIALAFEGREAEYLAVVFIQRAEIDLGQLGIVRWTEGSIVDYERVLRSAVCAAQRYITTLRTAPSQSLAVTEARAELNPVLASPSEA